MTNMPLLRGKKAEGQGEVDILLHALNFCGPHYTSMSGRWLSRKGLESGLGLKFSPTSNYLCPLQRVTVIFSALPFPLY